VSVSVGLPAEPGAGAPLVSRVRAHVPASAPGGDGGVATRARTTSCAVVPSLLVTRTVKVRSPGSIHDVTREPPSSSKV
jgi:hypothetical protein